MESEPSSSRSASSLQASQPCRHFDFHEIQQTTDDFDESLVIGRGGFGKVYKGNVFNGSRLVVAAIKRLDSMSSQGASEFRAEVDILSNFRHCNLVSLIGYCNHGKEMILVYEYMPNGTLEDHLHKLGTPLSWVHRLNICIGAARGLHYLHTGTGIQVGIIHRDVKSSNILLHESWAAKISDFGLSKIGPTNQPLTYVSTLVKGTFGYLDPDYFLTGRLTRKSDVYAFGVVLLEVLCRKRAVDATLDEEQWNLARWAQESIKKGNLKHIIDSSLKGQIYARCLKEFVRIVDRCLHNNPKKRYTMAEVVVGLESVLRLQEKFNSSLQHAGRTVFGRMVDMIPFPYKGENSGNLTLAGEVGSKSKISAHHIQKSNCRGLRTFTYAELVTATNNFQDKEHSLTLLDIIYKGWVDERTYAPTSCGVGLAMYVRKKHIVKLEVHLELKPKEFDHPNLIKLLGYCLNGQELFCVYELIPETSLDKHLFGGQGTNSLSWVARLKIAAGAAEGLSFLHQRKHPAYIQFKTTLIWLDTDFNARLSDFQVEKSSLDHVSYSFGMDAYYAAPEWFRYQAYKLDSDYELYHFDDDSGVKSEIYTFGVILLEILTGMKVFDVNRTQGKQSLVSWASPLLDDEVNLGIIMDPQLLRNNYPHPPKGAFKLALLVSKCLQPTPDKRPSMEEILQALYECYLGI